MNTIENGVVSVDAIRAMLERQTGQSFSDPREILAFFERQNALRPVSAGASAAASSASSTPRSSSLHASARNPASTASQSPSATSSNAQTRPKGFIRAPVTSRPQSPRTDVVARFSQYQQTWAHDGFLHTRRPLSGNAVRAPNNNNNNNNLLKNTKGKVPLVSDRYYVENGSVRPRNVVSYEKNTYVVPTEKRRDSLRWEIREKLLNTR